VTTVRGTSYPLHREYAAGEETVGYSIGLPKGSTVVKVNQDASHPFVIGSPQLRQPTKGLREREGDLRVSGWNLPDFIGYAMKDSYDYYKKISQMGDENNKQTVYRKLDALSQEDPDVFLEVRMVGDGAFAIKGVTWEASGKEVLFKYHINPLMLIAKYGGSTLIRIPDKIRQAFKMTLDRAFVVPALDIGENREPFILPAGAQRKVTVAELRREVEKERGNLRYVFGEGPYYVLDRDLRYDAQSIRDITPSEFTIDHGLYVARFLYYLRPSHPLVLSDKYLAAIAKEESIGTSRLSLVHHIPLHLLQKSAAYQELKQRILKSKAFQHNRLNMTKEENLHFTLLSSLRARKIPEQKMLSDIRKKIGGSGEIWLKVKGLWVNGSIRGRLFFKTYPEVDSPQDLNKLATLIDALGGNDFKVYPTAFFQLTDDLTEDEAQELKKIFDDYKDVTFFEYPMKDLQLMAVNDSILTNKRIIGEVVLSGARLASDKSTQAFFEGIEEIVLQESRAVLALWFDDENIPQLFEVRKSHESRTFIALRLQTDDLNKNNRAYLSAYVLNPKKRDEEYWTPLRLNRVVTALNREGLNPTFKVIAFVNSLPTDVTEVVRNQKFYVDLAEHYKSFGDEIELMKLDFEVMVASLRENSIIVLSGIKNLPKKMKRYVSGRMASSKSLYGFWNAPRDARVPFIIHAGEYNLTSEEAGKTMHLSIGREGANSIGAWSSAMSLSNRISTVLVNANLVDDKGTLKTNEELYQSAFYANQNTFRDFFGGDFNVKEYIRYILGFKYNEFYLIKPIAWHYAINSARLAAQVMAQSA
jgi:hypothetical protein